MVIRFDYCLCIKEIQKSTGLNVYKLYVQKSFHGWIKRRRLVIVLGIFQKKLYNTI